MFQIAANNEQKRLQLIQQQKEQQAQQSQAAQEETPSTSQTLSNEPAPEPEDDFQSDLIEEVKPSADTIIQEDGTKVVNPAPRPEPATATEPTVEDQYKNAMQFVELREMIQSRGIAMVADGTMSTFAQYTYTPTQKKQLAEAWHPVLVRRNIKISPEAQLVITELMCNAPLLQLMMQNRKYRKKAEAAEAENERLRRQIAEQNGNFNNLTGNAIRSSDRKDNKNAWKVDSRGYFIFRPAGASTDYLKEELRTERPKLPADLEKLILYNGREAIAEIFKMPELNKKDDAQS